MTHSMKYKRLAKKLGSKSDKPGSLIDRMHSLKGMPKKKHHKIQNPNFIGKGSPQFYGPGFGAKNAPKTSKSLAPLPKVSTGMQPLQGGKASMPAAQGVVKAKKHKMPKTFGGKSTKPGMGGRAKMLEAKGVPKGVIGAIARSKGEAPGQKGFHKKHMKMACKVHKKMNCKVC